MASNQGHLYDPPSSRRSHMNPTYDFDPKAVTRASWSQASINSSPKPKQVGPLIDFNRHPDSYVIVPGSGNDDLPPLAANTRAVVTTTRWLQFTLRILQLIGALGLLTCIICLKHIATTLSWIMRIPPAWDAAICCYALYHLARPANSRTPMSSASYHGFALIMDIGLIPFMVVTAYFSQKNRAMASGADGRWTSYFNTTGTNIVLMVTWITAITVGALHLFSVGFDGYLLFIFRKISSYAPDSNPLRDDFAARSARKHAHKNSELTVSISEKKLSNMSGSTLNLHSSSANVRPMSFYQSRQNLDQSYSAHTQDSARMSRANLYQGPASAVTSRTELNSRGGRPTSRPASAHSRSQSRSRSRPRSQGGAGNRASYLSGQSEHDPMPARPMSFISGSAAPSRYASPRPNSFLSGSAAPSRYSTPLAGPQAHVPMDVAKLQQKEGLLNDNWYSFPETDGDLSSARHTPQPPQHADVYSDDDLSRHQLDSLLPKPLSKKAPTPPQHRSSNEYTAGDDSNDDNGAFYFSDMPSGTIDAYGNSHDSSLPTQSYLDNPKTLSYGNVHSDHTNTDTYDDNADVNSAHNSEGTIGRALTVTSAISAASSFYSQSNTPQDTSRAASPKRKAYGDLAAATAGVLGQGQLSVPKQQQHSDRRGKSHSRERRENEGRALQRGHVEKGGRVVSRTGVDLADASVLYLGTPSSSANTSQQSSLRGRQVSGKIAEEGLAGPRAGGSWYGGGVRRREVSGTA